MSYCLQGIIPKEWRTEYLKPIYKCDESYNTSNIIEAQHSCHLCLKSLSKKNNNNKNSTLAILNIRFQVYGREIWRTKNTELAVVKRPHYVIENSISNMYCEKYIL